MSFLNKHSFFALIYFFLIAFLGVFLRLYQIVDLPADYKFIVHTHSHVALLGWVYTALTTLIYKLYLGNASIEKKYRILFWCTQITIVGMLLTFPFTGYALFSIIFSTLFLFASYSFVWLFIRYTTKEQKRTNSYRCIHVSLWFMAMSSIGPWALGAIMASAGSGSDLYRNAIYFYLHFQYNGWFVMALFGILIHILEKQGIVLEKKSFNHFFWTINAGAVLTFGISLLWMKPPILIYVISGIGALLQFLAMVILAKQLFLVKKRMKKIGPKLFYRLLKTIGLLFLVKLFLQLLGAFPYFAAVISYNMDFVIGYLHWIFLGVVSLALLVFLDYFKLILLTKESVLIYVIGFILTEGLIFYKGFVVWLKVSLAVDYFWHLVLASVVVLIAIGNIFKDQLRKTTG